MKNILKKYSWVVYLVTVSLLFVLIRIALYDGLTVSYYNIESDNVSTPHTFVIVTDLHSTFYGENQEILTEKIGNCSPEAVLLVGDISEDRRDFEGTAVFLEAIADKYPCYYVTGNHERWIYYANDARDLFREYGVTVLSESSIFLGDGIVLHGIDDPLFYNSTDEFLSALSKFEVSDDKFDILLSHRPEFAEAYADKGFDLTVCGHAHGGQVRLPFFQFGLYAPHQGFFPKYTSGKYSFGESSVIVSRGLMIDDLPRVFNPPQIVVLTVSPK